MTIKLPLLIATAGMALAWAPAMADSPPPAATHGNAYWAGVDWDDDDDRRRQAAMPIPNASALKRAGMVRVKEVERDDGLIEVEGFDSKGRELEVRLDARAQHVLSVRHDD